MSRSLASVSRVALLGVLVLSCSSSPSSNFGGDGGGTSSGVQPGGSDPVTGGGRRAGNDPGMGVSGTDPSGAGGRGGAGGLGGNASVGAGGQPIGAGGGVTVRLDGGAATGGTSGGGMVDMAGPPKLDMAAAPKIDAFPVDSSPLVDLLYPIDQSTSDAPGMCGVGSACGDLEAQYEAAFKKAQVCVINAANQCDVKVPSSLGCPVCESWVNSKDELSSIRAKWEDMSCGKCHRLCPLIRCLQIAEGTCGAGAQPGRTGVCAEKKPVLAPN